MAKLRLTYNEDRQNAYAGVAWATLLSTTGATCNQTTRCCWSVTALLLFCYGSAMVQLWLCYGSVMA